MQLKHKVIGCSLILVVLFSVLYIQLFSIKNISHSIYVCQVGIFSKEENAKDMVEEMNRLGFVGNYYIKEQQYFVLGAIHTSKEEAVKDGEKISNSGKTCVVKEYFLNEESIKQIKEGEYELVLKELEH